MWTIWAKSLILLRFYFERTNDQQTQLYPQLYPQVTYPQWQNSHTRVIHSGFWATPPPDMQLFWTTSRPKQQKQQHTNLNLYTIPEQNHMSLLVVNTGESSDPVYSWVLSICNTIESLYSIVYTVFLTVSHCAVLEPVRELCLESGQHHHCRGDLMRCNGV